MKHTASKLFFLTVFALISAVTAAQSSSSSSSSTSSSSTSSASSGGQPIWITTPVCPEVSEGQVVGELQDYSEFDPDDLKGSTVTFKSFHLIGGPEVSRSMSISYANGSDFNRPMTLIHQTGARKTIVSNGLTFPPTGSWDTWESFHLSDVPFLDGQFFLISDSDEGGPNLKSLSSSVSIMCGHNPCGGGGGVSNCPLEIPTPPALLSCSVGPAHLWNDGYILSNVTVTNDGNSSIDRWEMELRFAEAPQIENAWNADIATDALKVTAKNLAWNARVAPGQSYTFGMVGKHDGSFTPPSCRMKASAQ